MHPTLTVKFSRNDSGNCRVYYRAINLNEKGKAPIKLNLLICKQEESADCYVWYRCTNDGCWEEPEAVIKHAMRIVDEDGTVLRDTQE